MTSLTNLCLHNLALQDYDPSKEENIPIELKEKIKEISYVAKKCIDSTMIGNTSKDIMILSYF